VREIHPGAQIGDRNADAPRAAAWRAGDAHKAAEPLRDLIDAWPLAVRAVLPETRVAAVHDARVDRLQRLIVHLEPVLHLGAEVFHHDVGILDHAVEHRAAGVGLKIECERALVAMQVFAVERGERRVEPALLGAQHLGDLCTMIREHAHAGRPGPRDGEVEDLDVGERAGAAVCGVCRHGESGPQCGCGVTL
jgi:hypothetical protein